MAFWNRKKRQQKLTQQSRSHTADNIIMVPAWNHNTHVWDDSPAHQQPQEDSRDGVHSDRGSSSDSSSGYDAGSDSSSSSSYSSDSSYSDSSSSSHDSGSSDSGSSGGDF